MCFCSEWRSVHVFLLPLFACQNSIRDHPTYYPSLRTKLNRRSPLYYEYITIYYEYSTILNSLPYDTHISLLFTGVVPFITNIILFITHYHLLRMTQGAGRNQRDPRVPDHHLKYTWVSTCRHLLRICSISTSPTPKCLWEGRPQWKEGL